MINIPDFNSGYGDGSGFGSGDGDGFGSASGSGDGFGYSSGFDNKKKVGETMRISKNIEKLSTVLKKIVLNEPDKVWLIDEITQEINKNMPSIYSLTKRQVPYFIARQKIWKLYRNEGPPASFIFVLPKKTTHGVNKEKVEKNA